MTFHILSIFPQVFSEYPNVSILKRAQEKKIISIRAYDLRKWATDKHHKVDDIPYGGGPGMVMKVEPIDKAVQDIQKKIKGGSVKSKSKKAPKIRTILFSTRGKLFTNKEAKRLSKYNHLIFICGRYEGVDERVASHIADEEISIGDYVLSGGELPALVVMDSVARQIDGVLGKAESLEEVNGSYASYTKPEIYFPNKKSPDTKSGARSKHRAVKWAVPKVLLSGNHKKINEFRNLTGKRAGE